MARYTRTTDLVEIEVDEVKRERDLSLIVVVDGEEVVIPKSLIGETSEVREAGDSGMLVIPKWLAEDRGLL